jgi:haloacetate dehalogenase
MWSKIAPRLAQNYTVVCPDLRGYGGSSKPESTANHEPYSKRAMARDQLEVMKQLGHDKFRVAGHDRGGRVAYRLALDSPQAVTKLAVLDIVPTGDTLRRADWRFGMGYWHWFFLAQAHPVPEKMISADPVAFLFRNGQGFSDFDAYEDYLQNARDPAAIHAMCEDYRAAVSVDFQQDQADRGTRKIECPTLVMWKPRSRMGDAVGNLEGMGERREVKKSIAATCYRRGPHLPGPAALRLTLRALLARRGGGPSPCGFRGIAGRGAHAAFSTSLF